MKIKILILFILFHNVSLKSQSNISTIYAGNLSQSIGLKQLDSNKFVTVINETSNSNGDISIVYLNVNNQIIFTKSYDLGNNSNDKAYDFIIDRDKNIVIVGSFSPYHSFILKIDGSDGSVIFSKYVRNQNSSLSSRIQRIYQMNKSTSDDYILTGMLNFPHNLYVARLTKMGNNIWSKQYDVTTGNDLLYCLTEASNGDIILGGAFTSSTIFDSGILKIDPTTGNVISIFSFNFNYASYSNSGFDNVTKIEGTDLLVFSLVVNNGTSDPTRQGIAIYNTKTEKIIDYALYNIINSARGNTIIHNPKKNEIVVGCFYATNKEPNLLIQRINLSDLSKVKIFKIKDIIATFSTSGSAYVNIDYNGDYLISGFVSNLSNKNIGKAVISKTNFVRCYDSIKYNMISVTLPNPTIPTINLLSEPAILNFSPKNINLNYVITTLCEVDCYATKKEFRIATTKKIDTICFNQAYSWTVSTASNPKDSSLNFVLYKKNGTALLPLDSIKNKTGKTFNLPYSSNNETYIVIAKTKCSFNDTVILNLVAHKLSVSTLLHNNYYCKNETVNLISDYTASCPKKVAFRWFDSTTNKILDSFSSLQIRAEFSQSIGLTVNDQCAESKTIYTRFYVAPSILDSLILTKKMDCEPLKTELVHPKTVANGTMSFKFKWMWQMDGTAIDSTETEAGKTEPNRPLTIAQSGFYKLKTYMALPNSKVCVVFNDTARVVKKAVANFNINPEFIDISKATVVFNNFSNYAFKYQWTISDGGSYSDLSPSHTFNKIGAYNVSLIAYSISGCNDTLSKTLTVNDIYNIYIPNSFTPNGDGNNNVWKPEIISGDKIDLEIFNRWGELIYHSKDESASWDGTYKNEICQEGMYLYMLKVTSKTKKIYYYRGMISLLR